MGVLQNLRALLQLGNNGFVPVNALYNVGRYKENQSAGPSGDLLGTQYVRDGMSPAPYCGPNGAAPDERYPQRSFWQTFINVTDVAYIGRYPVTGAVIAANFFACMLYQLYVTGGAAGDWAATPTYVQVHWPVTAALAPAAVPDHVWPLPREPNMLALNLNNFGPICSAQDLGSDSGGMAIALSSTRNTYTAVVAPASATIVANWAFLGQRIPNT